MKTKFKIIILITVVLIIILGLLFLRQRSTRQSQIIQTSGLSISTYVQQTFPVNVQFTKSDFNFPSSLPLLDVGTASVISLDQAKGYAKSFGFNSDPQALTDTIDGTVYFWANNNSSLTIRPKSNQIKFLLSQGATSRTRLTETNLISKTGLYLVQRNLTSQTNTKTAFVSYQKNGGEGTTITTIDQADFAYVNFAISEADYKVVTINPLSSPLRVRVLPDGTVVEVDIIRLPQIAKGNVLYQLKNFDQFNTAVTSSKIVSLDDGNMVSPNPLTNPIKSVNASSIELAYLMNSLSSTTCQPVFVIKGTADIEGLGNNISVYLYLPAFAGQ